MVQMVNNINIKIGQFIIIICFLNYLFIFCIYILILWFNYLSYLCLIINKYNKYITFFCTMYMLKKSIKCFFFNIYSKYLIICSCLK